MDREFHPACGLSAVLPRRDARVPRVRLLVSLPILNARLRRWRGLRATVTKSPCQTSLILATILVVAALGLDFIAPLFLNS